MPSGSEQTQNSSMRTYRETVTSLNSPKALLFPNQYLRKTETIFSLKESVSRPLILPLIQNGIKEQKEKQSR